MERTDQIAAIEEAVDYIQANLDGDLAVEAIADRACFSRHYFNRLFSSVTGEPVHAFVRRLRLERAAFRLMKSPEMSLTEIALEARYSPSNFAVAFRERFGMSASGYRAAPPPPPCGAYEKALERIAALRGPGAEAARYARYRFDGPVSGLIHAFNDLIAIWMPRRGFRPGPGPCLERYRSGLDAEGRVSVDICAPVEGKA